MGSGAGRRPPAGGRNFALPLRINYEDTDAGGVVYYANYLAYMERARNAWLRRLGFSLTGLERRHRVLFAVTEARLKYRAAGRLDDELEATLEIMRLQRASMRVRQTVRRGGDLLVDGEIRLGLVNSDTFKPCRMPAELADAINRWSRSGQAGAART